VCLIVCYPETSEVRWPRHELVCSTTKRKSCSNSTKWARSPYAKDSLLG